jgi:hypothetical protein
MQATQLTGPARPAADEFAPYYGKYVERVPDGDLAATLERNILDTAAFLRSPKVQALAEHRYASGKWSVKEVIGHLMDAERVFAYRMMRFGRADTTELPGFDENAYVPAGEFGTRTLDDLVGEFVALRAATVTLIRGMPQVAWTRRGVASNNPISARALAWVIAGHELHHRAVLEERYFG